MTTAIESRLTKVNLTPGSVGFICAFTFIWALMEVIVQHIPERYSIYQIVWVRYAVHLLFMLVVFGRSRGKKLIFTRRPGLAGLLHCCNGLHVSVQYSIDILAGTTYDHQSIEDTLG
jgi:drug/metabolite transporter (DMT)-like permease